MLECGMGLADPGPREVLHRYGVSKGQDGSKVLQQTLGCWGGTGGQAEVRWWSWGK